MRNIGSLILLSILVASCNSGHDFVFNHENLFVMSHPTADNIRHFELKGGTAVLQISDAIDKSLEDKSGVQFAYFSDKTKRGISSVTINSISEKVDSFGSQSLLIHGPNINKVAYWLAFYLHQKKGFTVEEAISRASGLGLEESWKASLREALGVAK